MMEKKTLLKALLVLSLFLFTSFPQANAQWTSQQSGTINNFYSIHFIDNNNGFCVGDAGTVCKTTNGGNNWTTYTNIAWANFNYVRMFSINNIIIGSSLDSDLLISTNGGINWTNLTLPEFNRKLQFVSFTHGFFFANNKFYRTTDGGQNWTWNYVPYFGFGGTTQDFHFLNETTGWLSVVYWDPYPWPYGSYWARVSKTSNAGVNWVSQYIKNTDNIKTYRIFFANLNTGFLNENPSTYSFMRTTNSGLNWGNVFSSGTSKKYYSMSFPGSDTGFFTGDQTIKTINGGATWSTITTPGGNVYRSVFFIDNLTGWIAGYGGLIVKTITGATKIKPISNIIPESFKLYQNYPNPFNPSTTIRFLLPTSSFIKLTVYNNLGKEIATLVNEELNAGSYGVIWPASVGTASNYPSGVYFYRIAIHSDKLFTKDFVDVKKMLLIK